MANNLGRVAYVNRGPYDSDSTYEKYDVVFYRNSSYVYINEIAGGVFSPDYETHWTPMLDATGLETDITGRIMNTLGNTIETAVEAAAVADNAATLANAVIYEKVFIKPRGRYSPTKEYRFLDAVEYEGSSYLYANITPSKGSSISNAGYWMLMAAKGEGTGVDGLVIIDGKLYLSQQGVIISNGVTLPKGGGGGDTPGGGGGSAAIVLGNLMPSSIITIATGNPLILNFSYRSTEDNEKGTARVYVNEVLKDTIQLTQGANNLDVTKYLTSGVNVIRLYCYDMFSNNKSITYTVTSIDLTIRSSFDDSLVQEESFSFRFTPYGEADKLIYFIIDGVEVATQTVIPSGQIQSQTIPKLSHGSHIFEVYASAIIGGEIVNSNRLRYDIVALETGNLTPIITSAYNVTHILQGQLVEIPYVVYDPAHTSTAITLTISQDGEELPYSTQEITVGQNRQFWRTKDYPAGLTTFTITYGSISRAFTIDVEENIIPVSPITNDLQLHLNSRGRSNNEVNPGVWSNMGATTTFTNFNWVNTGWIPDKNGDVALRVSGQARATIHFKPFAVDAKLNGRTIEIEYAVKDVNNRDAVAIACISDGIGFYATSDTMEIVSEQSHIKGSYKDDEINRISIVIEPYDGIRLFSIYLNGVLSKTTQYPNSDNFGQTPPVDIVLGSELCTLDLYRLRVYEVALTDSQIRDNFVADTADVAEKANRYTRNHGLYDGRGNLDFMKVKDLIPIMVVTGDFPRVKKTDKQNVLIEFYDPNYPHLNFADRCIIDVQGTSSQYYVRKNWKLVFEQDHQHAPNRLPTKVFCMKADYAEGTGTHNTQNANYVEDLYSTKTPPQQSNSLVRTTIYGFPCVIYHKPTPDSEPIFYGKYNFNYDKGALPAFGFDEINYPLAECWEFKNNTSGNCIFTEEILNEKIEIKTYNPYDTTAVYQMGDVVKHNDSVYTYINETAHIAFAPPLETHWELTPDATPVSVKEDWAWSDNFEARQPDGYENITQFKIMHDWVVSTDTKQATNEILSSPFVDFNGISHTHDTAAYRLAKFKTQCPTYFNMHFTLLFYVYTFVMLMVDQRAKNVFLTTWDGIKWEPWFYDNDTCLGINNEGQLIFDYYHEDDSFFEGAAVYNGKDSVLWNNFKNSFPDEIRALYQSLRSTKKLTYDLVIDHFITNGSDKWTESLYNEDTEFKYISMLRTENDAANLYQVRGTGEEHLRYFMSARFKYLDSKWLAPDYVNDFIFLRVYTPAEGTWGAVAPDASITLTSFSDMYGRVRYTAEGTSIEHRLTKNIPQKFTPPINSGFSDTETAIYGASEISSLGDLSGLYAGWINVVQATKLKELIIGNGSYNYVNNNLTTLAVGNNLLLKKIDIRGCMKFNVPLQLDGCPNIEHIYAERTSIPSVNLPASGYIRTLRLPATITNLTILHQKHIEDFSCAGYSNISSLRLENVHGVPIETVLGNATSLVRARLVDVDLTFQDDRILNTLAYLKGIDASNNEIPQSVLTGKVYVNDTALSTLIDSYRAIWPLLDLEFREITPVHTVRFLDYSGNVINSFPVIDGESIVPPVPPVLERTETHSFTFDKWSKPLTNIRENTDIQALYTESLYYTVIFKNWDEVVVDTQYIDIHKDADRPINPKKPNIGNLFYLFNRWDQPYTNITENMTIYPIYDEVTQYVVIFQDWDGRQISLQGVYAGDTAILPVPPTREPLDKYAYEFSGWSLPHTNIQEDTTFIAQYTPVVRTYLVTYKRGSGDYGGYEELTEVVDWGDIPKNIFDRQFHAPTYASAPNQKWKFVEYRPSRFEPIYQDTDFIPVFENWNDPMIIPLSVGPYACAGELNPEIPATVRKIGEYAYKDCYDSLTLTALPENLTEIGRGAFYNCSRLSLVRLPEAIRDIPEYAFYNCTSLRFRELPPLINSIGKFAFTNCIQLNLDTIDSRATISVIEEGTFMNCTNIVFTSLHDNITVIKKNAFSGCSELLLSSLPYNLETIGEGAFSGCFKIALTTLPSKITEIEDNTFINCKLLKLSALPIAITSIGKSAFEGCSILPLSSLSNNITYIGEKAFQNCSLVTISALPTSPLYTKIEDWTFNNCTSLSITTLPPQITTIGEYAFTNGTFTLTALPDDVIEIGMGAFQNCKNIQMTTLPSGMDIINSHTFQGCEKLALTTLPDITEIGEYAFSGCKKLALVENALLLDNLIKIKNYAFNDCELITIESLPFGLVELGNYAFAKCANIKIRTIPAGITVLEPYVFSDCTRLNLAGLANTITEIRSGAFTNCKELTLDSLPNTLTVINSGSFQGCSSLALTQLPPTVQHVYSNAFSGCSALALTSLPEGLLTIAPQAFYGCAAMTLNTFPDTLTAIGSFSFSYCTNVAFTELPENLTVIDSHTFTGCSSLKLTHLPPALTVIRNNAFSSCSVLDFVNPATQVMTPLPETITSIEAGAFASCTALKLTSLPPMLTVIADDTFAYCENLALTSLPSGLTSIGARAFTRCLNLNITGLPLGILTIGESAFKNAKNLSFSTFPANLKVIEDYTFEECEFTTIPLPEGLTKIGKYAFQRCYNLSNTSLPSTITSIGDYAFYDCPQLALTSLPEISRVGLYTFYNCGEMTLSSLPETITQISAGSFYKCAKITLTALPLGITDIPDYCFAECSLLALSKLPKTTTSIGVQGFQDCISILSLQMGDIDYPMLNNILNTAFLGCVNLHTFTIYTVDALELTQSPWGASPLNIIYLKSNP